MTMGGISGNPWVWLVIQDPGQKEQFLGVRDEERNQSFIPIFLEKKEALDGLEHLPVEKEKNCEIQAIQYQEIARHAAEQAVMLFVLNGKGEILEKITP
ncbi:MAG: hypothetical protein JRJ85_02660 [Deltaproteobacteria bacterium]|nr:hypothetical protein [Deltaproteobacteria bacterium]